MHQVIERSGGVFDVLEEGDFRVTVNRSGAEMVSLQRRAPTGEWRGFLYRDGDVSAPASGWANHATVMGYFLHRLWKEQSLYRGQLIRGGNHGFLRHFAFAAPEIAGAAMSYHVPADRVPREAYPLKVSLALTYALSQEGLRVEFAFRNEEPELTAHVSFGLHPGFAVASPKTCRVLFPAGVYTRHFAPGNFLNGELETIDFPGGDMPFARENLEGSYLVGLEAAPVRVFQIEDPESGRRVVLDFSEVPFLTVWSDMNPFICLEPCWGLPDSNPPRPFEEKEGIQTIAPGAVLRRGFGIKPECI